MDRIFRIILFILLILSKNAFASAENPTRAELLQTVRHIQALARELQTDLDNEKAAHAIVNQKLAEATTDLNAATDKNRLLQLQINTLTEKANKAIADHAKILAKYHFLKLLASIIAAAAAMMLVLQFGKFIPPPYNFYLMAGAGIGAATAVWIFL